MGDDPLREIPYEKFTSGPPAVALDLTTVTISHVTVASRFYLL
jgi:hypothetical protein